jgi:hypothetical protein
VGGEARVSTRQELGLELSGDGGLGHQTVEKSLTEQPHQRLAVPLLERMKGPVGGEAAVSDRHMEVWMPRDQIPGGGNGDHDSGPCVFAELPAHVLGQGLGTALR